jgi:hypothetical protein
LKWRTASTRRLEETVRHLPYTALKSLPFRKRIPRQSKVGHLTNLVRFRHNKFISTLEASSLDYISTIRGRHSLAKAMSLHSVSYVRLIRSLHR